MPRILLELFDSDSMDNIISLQVRSYDRAVFFCPAGAVPNERTRRLLEDAKLANMNCVRVWGGGEYFSKDGEGACRDLNDGWRKALTAWREAIDKGWYFVPSQTTGNHWDEFLAGKMPFCFHSSGNLGNAITKSEGVFTLGVAPLAGKTMEDGSVYRRVYTGGANLMLSANKSEEEIKISKIQVNIR